MLVNCARCASAGNHQAPFLSLSSTPPLPVLEGVAKVVLDCAHRTIYIAPSKLARYLSGNGGCLIFNCARPTRGVFDRALREHRRPSGSIPSTVLRARRAPGHSFPLLLLSTPRTIHVS